jgi:hypothetical protein
MAGQTISQQNYDDMVAKDGPQAAAQFIRKYGIEIRPNEVEFTPISGMSGDGENGMEDDTNADFAVADEDAADNTGDEGTSLAVGGPKTDTYTDWEREQLAYMKKAQAQRLQQFNDAKAYIEKNYRGPSLSEQLFAMSQAFLSPTSMPGFKGTLANITPVFGQIAKAQRTSEEQRAEALMKLQQQYQTGELNAEGDVLKNRLALIRARATGGPKVDVNPKGGYQVRPGTGGAPPFPDQDAYGNYVITDIGQLKYLPPNTPVVEVGQDPTKPKYVQDR